MLERNKTKMVRRSRLMCKDIFTKKALCLGRTKVGPVLDHR